ncbi:hypothetical protein NQ317_015969 [Molorchus minor]|uniref:Secreted protein n=1 Tax=Molorchus minor TaxID=1323400 RepID=A0ABQ9JKI2_9CUCU|nr:hypothetical protein NQ317_015969 [Molorchus minor]
MFVTLGSVVIGYLILVRINRKVESLIIFLNKMIRASTHAYVRCNICSSMISVIAYTQSVRNYQVNY